MRKVTYGGACSLDGYIAGPNGEVDWLFFSKDVQQIMAEFWKGMDTIVMGRKTWDVAVAMGGADSEQSPYPGIKCYVVSHTLPSGETRGATIVNGDAAEFVRDLKQQEGGDICIMGGGELAQSLFNADLIDEVGMNIHPILLGGGIPGFRPLSHSVKLELVEQRLIEGGCVYVIYKVSKS